MVPKNDQWNILLKYHYYIRYFNILDILIHHREYIYVCTHIYIYTCTYICLSTYIYYCWHSKNIQEYYENNHLSSSTFTKFFPFLLISFYKHSCKNRSFKYFNDVNVQCNKMNAERVLKRESWVPPDMRWTKKVLGSLKTEEQGLNNQK